MGTQILTTCKIILFFSFFGGCVANATHSQQLRLGSPANATHSQLAHSKTGVHFCTPAAGSFYSWPFTRPLKRRQHCNCVLRVWSLMPLSEAHVL